MTRLRIVRLSLVLGLVLAVQSAALLLKGGFHVAMHEGDTLHLLDMMMRMAEGQWPHLDFMTPIGVLAVAPMAALAALGVGAGQAILGAQVAVAVLLFPVVVRVAASRFPGAWAHAFGIYTLVLVLALIHGEEARASSISMHYNRWAWALAYVAIPLALLPPIGPARPRLDGVVIGLAMAGLALMKMTYFVALAGPVALAILLRRDRAMALAAIGAGLAVAAFLTLLAGPSFWLTYAADLLTVARSESRPEPGEALGSVYAGPAHMTATLLIAVAVILLRQTPAKNAGLVLLLLFPAFVYITWQNWGNDPQWLFLLAFLVMALRPPAGTVLRFGYDLRQALTIVAVAAFANGAGSAINLASSPLHHYALDTGEMMPLVPGNPALADVLGDRDRALKRAELRPAPLTGIGLEAYAATEAEEPVVIAGEVMPDCTAQGAFTATYVALARDLEAAGYGGTGILAADLLSGFWLFGDFRAVRGAAPWYYDGLPGLEDSDYLLVPLCPTTPKVREFVAKAVAERGLTLTEVRRTPLYILYRPQAASPVAMR